MKKKTIFSIILLLFTLSSAAQKLPDWIINKPSSTNSTYLYVVESATGQTEQMARNRAIAEVLRSTAMRIGQPFDSEEINSALQRGTEYYVISSQYDIPINKVCEYTDNKTSPCRVYVLCQVAKAGNIHVEFDDFNGCYGGNEKLYANEALYADGCSVFKNGKKLSDSEVRTMFANSMSYDLYDQGRRIGYDCSPWFLAGGCLIFLGGVFQMGWVLGWDDPSGKGLIITGAGLVPCGLGLIITGSICSSVGKAKIRKAVYLYNNGRMYSQHKVEYGLTGNGVYLTFRF